MWVNILCFHIQVYQAEISVFKQRRGSTTVRPPLITIDAFIYLSFPMFTECLLGAGDTKMNEAWSLSPKISDYLERIGTQATIL